MIARGAVRAKEPALKLNCLIVFKGPVEGGNFVTHSRIIVKTTLSCSRLLINVTQRSGTKVSRGVSFTRYQYKLLVILVLSISGSQHCVDSVNNTVKHTAKKNNKHFVKELDCRLAIRLVGGFYSRWKFLVFYFAYYKYVQTGNPPKS